ncbi:MAG: dTMP kinase, partial [bacterium]|nr:dTMP kinase [bacterium]
MKHPGKYVVFEGVVGSGKSVQSQLLVAKLQQKFPDRMVVWTREPGGSEIAGEIRRVVQGMMFAEDMDPICEQYLYAASRAQTLRSIVRPVLDRGGIVVADRSFFTSLAFQGYGRGLGIQKVLDINHIAIENLWPDLVVYVDMDLKTALTRTNDKRGDKFEAMDEKFFKKVQRGYKEVVGK